MLIRGWRSVDTSLFRWASTINKICTRSGIRAPLGSELYVTTDSSGQLGKSAFWTLGILLADFSAVRPWASAIRSLRASELPDGRQMAYKKLNDGLRRRALPGFLAAADLLPGVLVTIAVPRRVDNLCEARALLAHEDSSILLGNWSPADFEAMLRVVHFVSIFVAGLTHPAQNVTWISDQDQMFANERRSQDTAKFISGITSHYVKHEMGALGVGTTALDEGDRLEEDLGAIPDLAAGVVSDLLERIGSRDGVNLLAGVDRLLPDHVPRNGPLIEWLADESQPLQRLHLCFSEASHGRIGFGRWQLKG